MPEFIISGCIFFIFIQLLLFIILADVMASHFFIDAICVLLILGDMPLDDMPPPDIVPSDMEPLVVAPDCMPPPLLVPGVVEPDICAIAGALITASANAADIIVLLIIVILLKDQEERGLDVVASAAKSDDFLAVGH